MVQPAQHRSIRAGRLERARRRRAALEARAKRVAERAQKERQLHSSVDAAFEIADRDIEVGGSIIAGALAYRLFIWLLPLALVFVAGLGIAADAASESPKEAAKSLGVAGLVSSSIASAGKSSARWYALLVGIPILVYVTKSLLRTLIGAHRLVWADLRTSAPKPKLGATLRLLGLLIAFFAVAALATAARAHSPGFGLVASLACAIAYGGIWLAVSLQLPHRQTHWKALIPGAIVFGLGAEVVQLAAAYVLAPYAISKQGTYGALGTAAALLLGLFILSRLVVLSAAVNATLAERHARNDASAVA